MGQNKEDKRTESEKQEAKRLMLMHTEFWKQLRDACNKKILEMRGHEDKDDEDKDDKDKDDGLLNKSKIIQLHKQKVPISVFALRQYKILVKDTETRFVDTQTKEKVSVYDIYLARTWNTIKHELVYKSIGRVKWYFVRRVVDIWWELVPQIENMRWGNYKFRQSYDFRIDIVEKCEEKMAHKQRFHIPKSIVTTRGKSAFVRYCQNNTENDDVTAIEDEGTDNAKVIASGIQNVPKNLREITFDGNCDSSPVYPK